VFFYPQLFFSFDLFGVPFFAIRHPLFFLVLLACHPFWFTLLFRTFIIRPLLFLAPRSSYSVLCSGTLFIPVDENLVFTFFHLSYPLFLHLRPFSVSFLPLHNLAGEILLSPSTSSDPLYKEPVFTDSFPLGPGRDSVLLGAPSVPRTFPSFLTLLWVGFFFPRRYQLPPAVQNYLLFARQRSPPASP